jgi:hypothetical protein
MACSSLQTFYIDPSDTAKRFPATEWLAYLWSAGQGRISWQVLHEFYWNAVKKMRLEPSAERELTESLADWGCRGGGIYSPKIFSPIAFTAEFKC